MDDTYVRGLPQPRGCSSPGALLEEWERQAVLAEPAGGILSSLSRNKLEQHYKQPRGTRNAGIAAWAFGWAAQATL